MIRSYKFNDSAIQLRLHEMVMDFFNRIEFEKGPFEERFLGCAFGQLAGRHKKIIKERCILIYEEIRFWNLLERTVFFNSIRESNEIESICKGISFPLKIDNTATGILQILRDLFISLYDQVLNGNPFNQQYDTTLNSHFESFSILNSDITLCPLCGIGELKKHTDTTRDQYDHYLPKAIYPLSSVNFKNLVPICKECNSFDVKGEKDIITIASNHKLFFLFDQNHKGITIKFNLIAETVNADETTWKIEFQNPDNKEDEIKSWKEIYNIDKRYSGFVNGRIEKWYCHYWEYMNNAKTANLSNESKVDSYNLFLELDENKDLNFLRRPSLNGYLADSIISAAAIEARLYS